jgi:hypothetical protein
MEETLTCDIWIGEKVQVVIDRETGKFDLFDSHLKLNIQDNKADLIDLEKDGEVSLCTGYLRGGIWYFEELDTVGKDKDPYIAVIQLLYKIFL